MPSDRLVSADIFGAGGAEFTAMDRAELLRTPAGPLESSPEGSECEASPGEGAARNKCMSALLDKVADDGRGQDMDDFDIPAVHTAQQHHSQSRSRRPQAAAQLEDIPLSNFRSRCG